MPAGLAVSEQSAHVAFIVGSFKKERAARLPSAAEDEDQKVRVVPEAWGCFQTEGLRG